MEDPYLINHDGVDPETIYLVEKELGRIQEMVSLMQERCEEVTSTEIDLSCSTPYSKFDVDSSLFALNSSGKLDDDVLQEFGIKNYLDNEVLHGYPEDDLKKLFTGIIAGYRQAMFNLVEGTVASTEKIEKDLLPKISPPRENSHEVVEKIIERSLSPILNSSDYQRAQIEVELGDIRTDVHEHWTSVFDNKQDKMLARKFIKGEIKKDEFMSKLKTLPEPTYKF